MRYLMCVFATLGLVAITTAQPPAAWVTIEGQVILPANDPIPDRKPLAVTQDQKHCLSKGPILDDAKVVNPKNRGIKNVVVWLRPADPNPRVKLVANEIHPGDAKRKAATVTIDQPCCAFEPHVLAARVGDTIEVNNPAPVAHNFFWASANNGQLNVNIPPKGKHRFEQSLSAEPIAVQYKCTIHPWMVGYVRVFDHPYYAVTDMDGKFTIANAPAGNYRLVYWHEAVGYLGGRDGRVGVPVQIAPGPNGTMVLKPTDFGL